MRISLATIVTSLVLTFMTVPADAAIVVNQSQVINLSQFVPCAAGGAGEMVDLSGPLHVLISFNINGSNVSGAMHFQPQGISGTGETTGDKYHATGLTETTFTQSLQNGRAQSTFVNRFDIIGQGTGNNFLVHETAHITFNSDGTVTVFFDNFSFECK